MNQSDLLHCWDKGRHMSTLQRALWYLHNDDPQLSWEQLQHLPIGERDRRILALRAQLFGSSLHVYTVCPQCLQELESHFDSDPWFNGVRVSQSLTFELDGAEVRLLDTVDQQNMCRLPPEQAEQFVLQNCVVVQENLDTPPLERVLDAMLQQDPLAEIILQLQCEQCGHTWSQLLDIVAFFQLELDNFCHSLLQQVHVLARAYGWSEQQILDLSVQRRETYLEMVMA